MMIGYKTGLACILAAISPLVAAIAGWLWGVLHGGPSASQSGVCDSCGYDLTGNLSGICPECGMVVKKDVEQQIEIHLETPHKAPSVEKASLNLDPVTASGTLKKEDAISAKPGVDDREKSTAPSRPFSEKEIEAL